MEKTHTKKPKKTRCSESKAAFAKEGKRGGEEECFRRALNGAMGSYKHTELVNNNTALKS